MGIKDRIRAWLEIEEVQDFKLNINEDLGFEANAIRNRIWYRGDANELEQLYRYMRASRSIDKFKFWAAAPTAGLEIQKRSTGIAGLIVDTLADIVLADYNGVQFAEKKNEAYWEDVAEDNDLDTIIEDALKEILYVGDGAFKISLDPEISALPIIEFWSGEKIDVKIKRGRLREIIFKSTHVYDHKKYELHEIYGYGYIRYELYHNTNKVKLSQVPELEHLVEVEFDKSYMMAEFVKFGKSDKWPGRGRSIYDRKIDSFDAFDEIWSQWMDAVRAGRTKEYIPEALVPRNEKTGALIKPNAFDFRFITVGTDISEGGKNEIKTESPTIPHESYLSAYITALDLCLQGIISPSTLGIDTKKLDNAEAQREKEKTTLYTRQKLVGVLSKAIPELVQIIFNVQASLQEEELKDIDVDLNFGEYANPSFESQVETVGKARTQGVMSVEASVDELYGDSKDDKWKETEVKRIKNEQGITEMEEPGVYEDIIDREEGLPDVDEGSEGGAGDSE